MAATETVAAGALEGCEVHQLRCCKELDTGDGEGGGFDIRLSVAPPLEGEDDGDPGSGGPYTIYVLDAEPCMFALVVCVVRSLHFYKKVQGGGHFPPILVVGISHGRRVTDDRSWWWKKMTGAVEKVTSILGASSLTDRIEEFSEAMAEILPDALTPAVEGLSGAVVEMLPDAAGHEPTAPVGEPEPVEDHWSRLRRLRKRDFTPPARDDVTDPLQWNEKATRGQALPFLRALEKDMIPFVESRYGANPSPQHRCLAGASLSALLACQAMLQGGTWGSVVLGSPSVWWDHDIILELVRASAQVEHTTAVDVLITVGSEESEKMLVGAKRLHEELQACEAWRTTYTVLQGEDHHTCKAALVGTLVRWLVVLWGHQPSPPELETEDPWGT